MGDVTHLFDDLTETRKFVFVDKGLAFEPQYPTNEHTKPILSQLAIDTVESVIYQLNDSFDKSVFDSSVVNVIAIQRILGGCFWVESKSRINFFNIHGALVSFSRSDAAKFLPKTFGAILNFDDITAEQEAMLTALARLNEKTVSEIKTKLKQLAMTKVIEEVVYSNQASRVINEIDMFATQSSIRVTHDTQEAAIITRHHNEYRTGYIDSSVIADYQEHFPKIGDFIQLIAASMFSSNRKKSFVWLHAPSDWGKGFFVSSLKHHGLVVEVSVKEIEAMLEGKPVGKDESAFLSAKVLFVDEWKNVKSEIKQLETETRLSPKYKAEVTVPLFVKLFASADTVESLVGTYGAEQQFINRMSYLRNENGKLINERPLFIKYGSDKYLESVSNWIGKVLNQYVASYRALGKESARKSAIEYIDKFHAENSLNQLGSIVDSHSEILREFAEWCIELYEDSVSKELTGFCPVDHAGNNVIFKNDMTGKQGHWVKSAEWMFERWVKQTKPISEQAMLCKGKRAILSKLDDNDGKPLKHNGSSIRAKRLPK